MIARDQRPRRPAFSLPELIVVLGLIMLLLGLLAPATSRAWRTAQAVECRSQLRQLGAALAAYANENKGVIYPFRTSSNDWPELLFDERVPPVLVCGTRRGEDFMSYQLNQHLFWGELRLEGNNSAGIPSSRIPLAGESRRGWYDGWSHYDQWTGTISWDPARHGPGLMSNYLWLDFHVDNEPLPQPVPPLLDPWWVPTQ